MWLTNDCGSFFMVHPQLQGQNLSVHVIKYSISKNTKIVQVHLANMNVAVFWLFQVNFAFEN